MHKPSASNKLEFTRNQYDINKIFNSYFKINNLESEYGNLNFANNHVADRVLQSNLFRQYFNCI
ncbi:hypothetical protein TUM4249_28920 [Shewanella sp. KT0246]|nr:hypothetical protein TUM4249_28920 [Shewanella sp. KT0246]